MGEKYAYIRVSTKEQNEDRQMRAINRLGIKAGNIYCDKQSGKDFERPRYRKMLRKMKKGDVLFIKSIDRLGRNYTEILNQWGYITKERQIDIAVLDMPLLDTRAKTEDLTGVFIADLVLQILSYVAQTEREFIRRRQSEGIAAAKARGVQFGRRKKDLPQDFDRVRQAWRDGRISLRQAGRRLNISHSTFYRRRKEFSQSLS